MNNQQRQPIRTQRHPRNKPYRKQYRKRPISSFKPYVGNLSPLGLPDKIRTQLTYADTLNINPGSQAGTYVFRGNSLFDPDYTAGGHQPYYFDQLAGLYSRYRVFSSRITVAAMNNVGTSPVQITIVPNSDVFALGVTTHPLEYPRARGARLLGVAGYNTTTVTHEAATAEILGLRPREILDEDFSALTGANPVSLWYWLVSAYDVQAANVNVGVQVKIVYSVEMYDRIENSPSLIKNPEQLPSQERKKMAGSDSDVVGPVTQVVVMEQPVSVAISAVK